MKNVRLYRNAALFFSVLVALICALLMTFSTFVFASSKAKQRTFSSPEDAVQAFVEAVRADDASELLAILGPDFEPVIFSGDAVQDQMRRERFAKDFEEKNSLQKQGDGKMILYVGSTDYPLPIPIVKKGLTWRFDTKAGKEEILTRHIGRNELDTIEVMRTYFDAQHEYASKDRNGDGAIEFGQKFVSTPGKKDGLYWQAGEGEEESPFGPLVAEAAVEGYKGKGGTATLFPFHGYYFKILKSQGKHAPGGAYSYLVNGKLILGFGLVAYPAKYGASGIMTFIINQQGIVYQKNLGKDTSRVAAVMKKYDPDDTWKQVD
ncbi:MAG: DUF2950 domain-containing protein [Dissulfurispiraceae bacterium]